MRYNMGIFLLIGFEKQTNKNTYCNTSLRHASFKTYVKQYYFNVYLYHTYK